MHHINFSLPNSQVRGPDDVVVPGLLISRRQGFASSCHRGLPWCVEDLSQRARVWLFWFSTGAGVGTAPQTQATNTNIDHGSHCQLPVSSKSASRCRCPLNCVSFRCYRSRSCCTSNLSTPAVRVGCREDQGDPECGELPVTDAQRCDVPISRQISLASPSLSSSARWDLPPPLPSFPPTLVLPSQSDDNKLKLYGLYKQATVGDINIAQPWAIQIEARAKWGAWNEQKGVSAPAYACVLCSWCLLVASSDRVIR